MKHERGRGDHVKTQRRHMFGCLSRNTLPGAQTGGMRACLVLPMVLGVNHRRNCQEPVYEYQAEQQRPDEPGLFQFDYHTN